MLLVEFHAANGLVLERAIMQNRTKYMERYESIDTKPVTTSTPIPLRFSPGSFLELFIRGARLRWGLRHTARGPLNPATTDARRADREELKGRLRSMFGEAWLQRILRARFALRRYRMRVGMRLAPDWGTWFVFWKKEEVSTPRFEIVRTYRRGNVFGRTAGAAAGAARAGVSS